MNKQGTKIPAADMIDQKSDVSTSHECFDNIIVGETRTLAILLDESRMLIQLQKSL